MYTRAKITSLFYGYKNADKYLHMRFCLYVKPRVFYTLLNTKAKV